MFSDLRFALRQIIKSPGYAIVVVLTLAFGIAVNTQVFGVVKLFVLQRMPVPDAEHLVVLCQRSDAWKLPHQVSFPDFKDYRDRVKSLTDWIAFAPNPANISMEGRSPDRAWVEVVTPNAFDALHIPAALGRTLVPSDGETAGGAALAVLSYNCWQTRFGGDRDIVGRSVLLNGRPFTIVGVAREGFHAFSAMLEISAFVPTSAVDTLRRDGAGWLQWRGAGMWRVMARIKPDSNLDAVRAEVAVVTQQIVADNSDSHHGTSSVVLPENRSRPDPSMSDYLPAVVMLFMGMVTLVLFIACANVANLMFARAVTRIKELAIRSALGASRLRLMRQLLVESVLLAGAAGVVGWQLAQWAGILMSQFRPQSDSVPIATNFAPTWENYVFTGVISLVAGLACGILPAMRASSVDLVDQIKQGATGTGFGRRHIARNLFVVGQVTFSVVVLACAALFLRSLHRMREVDLGFRSDHILVASFEPALQGYKDEKTRAFSRDLMERLRALPGVTDASLTSHVPFDTLGINGNDILPEDPPPHMKDGSTNAFFAVVEPGYLQMFGLRLNEGRALADTDTAATPRVAVINEAMARVCWPGKDAIGRRFRPWKDGPPIEVVGVAATAKYVMLTEEPRPYFYVPLAQQSASPLSVMVRTSVEPGALANDLRQVVHTLDPNLPIYNVRSEEDVIGQSPFPYLFLRMGSMVAGIQGAIGLLLAVMGLHAVVSFGVVQRTREIGIRVALGAQPGQVVRAIMRESVKLTIIGLAVGLVMAGLIGFGLSHMLYGLSAVDPIALGGVAIVLAGTALFACFWPARRATKVDPLVALRAE